MASKRGANLESLRMFDVAARHLNFRLAAEELNLTQGAVAQRVRSLEADLAVALFYRRARGLELTERGRKLHAVIAKALSIIEQAVEDLEPEQHSLTLSLTPSLASKWLVPRLASLAEQHPEIDLKVAATESLATFHADGVDLAVRQGHPPFGDNLVSHRLAPLTLCAVCAPKYASKVGDVADLPDLMHHRLIQDAHRHWESLLEEAGIRPERSFLQFNQTALAMDAASPGQGIALVPDLILESDEANKRLVRLWQIEPRQLAGFHIVHPSGPNPTRDQVVAWMLSSANRD